MAAHLHDSVLQTLALIQRNASDPRSTVALARRQERELREWLYAKTNGGAELGDGTLASTITRVATEVESLHQIRVELVTVGDLVLDARLLAVVASVREALVNAGKHAGVAEVSCYIEVTNCEVVAYVRDRGQGFDQDAVEPDRHGISRSIRGRMIRVGGSVEIESTSGEGTEVRLLLPLPGRTEATTP